MFTRRDFKVFIIAAVITLPALGAYHLLFKDYTIYQKRQTDTGYTIVVTAKRPLSDPFTFYMYVVVTSRSGEEIGRALLPLKSLDWPAEGAYYSITNLTLRDQDTRVYIESSRFPPLAVPIKIMPPD